MSIQGKAASFGGQWARPGRPAGRRRVLIHGINYAPELIGVGRYTSDFAEYLAEQGHAVEVVTAAALSRLVGSARRFATLAGIGRKNENGVRVIHGSSPTAYGSCVSAKGSRTGW